MLRLSFLCLAALSLLFACGKKDDEKKWKEKFRLEMEAVMQTHRRAVEAKFAALKSIGTQAEGAAKVETVLRPEESIAYTKMTEGEYLDGDILLINAELAGSRSERPQPSFRLSGTGELQRLEKYLGKTPVVYGEGAADAVGERFVKLTALKYAYVIRVHEYEKPVVSMSGGDERFQGGRLVGDAQLFSFDDAKKIGAFPFDVRQGVNAHVDLSQGAEGIDRGLENSLRVDFVFALERELKALLEGKEVGASSGEDKNMEHFRRQVFLDVSAEYLAALLAKVELDSDGDVISVRLYASSPSVLTNEKAAPLVKAIVAKALGTDNFTIDVRGYVPPT